MEYSPNHRPTTAVTLHPKRDRRDFPSREALVTRTRAALADAATAPTTLEGLSALLGVSDDTCRRVLVSIARHVDPSRTTSSPARLHLVNPPPAAVHSIIRHHRVAS